MKNKMMMVTAKVATAMLIAATTLGSVTPAFAEEINEESGYTEEIGEEAVNEGSEETFEYEYEAPVEENEAEVPEEETPTGTENGGLDETQPENQEPGQEFTKEDGPAAPSGLWASIPTSVNGTDGKVHGVNSTMEYSLDGGNTWRDVTGSEITGLRAGYVLVRVKETETVKAGLIATVAVNAYVAPATEQPKNNRKQTPEEEENFQREVRKTQEKIAKAEKEEKEKKEKEEQEKKEKEEAKKREEEKKKQEEREALEEKLAVDVVGVNGSNAAKANIDVVPATAYNLSGYTTTKGLNKGLERAIAASAVTKTVTIYSDKPVSLNATMLSTINNGKKTVVYYFMHENHVYSVTIPANVNAAKVLDKNGTAGPLYVGKVLGTTKVLR